VGVVGVCVCDGGRRDVCVWMWVWYVVVCIVRGEEGCGGVIDGGGALVRTVGDDEDAVRSDEVEEDIHLFRVCFDTCAEWEGRLGGRQIGSSAIHPAS
jgi:hypothetical protein